MLGAPVGAYIILSTVIFGIGGLGILIRRSPLVMLMSVELMWNAANLLFLTFARQHDNEAGHVFAFLVLTVAAAEVAIGLALMVVIFQRRRSVNADDLNLLRG